MKEKTAEILVKASKTDATFQRILVREGEYYHPQLSKWVSLPEEWEEKAKEALARRGSGGSERESE